MSDYDKLETELYKIPATWVPALLRVLLTRADVEVYSGDGLNNFIERTLRDVRDTGERSR